MVSRWELKICFPECVIQSGEVFKDFDEIVCIPKAFASNGRIGRVLRGDVPSICNHILGYFEMPRVSIVIYTVKITLGREICNGVFDRLMWVLTTSTGRHHAKATQASSRVSLGIIVRILGPGLWSVRRPFRARITYACVAVAQSFVSLGLFGFLAAFVLVFAFRTLYKGFPVSWVFI
jgi:hypothetical protein